MTASEANLMLPCGRAPADTAREHALAAGRRYLADRTGRPVALPFTPKAELAPSGVLVRVPLPYWAEGVGVGHDNALLVDSSTLLEGNSPPHERCDFLLAAFLHLECMLERAIERQSGSIQSYAYRLPESNKPAYQHAWANRIFLFLRRWTAIGLGVSEREVFAERPAARFSLTHDVDALSKTMRMRFKTSVMGGYAAFSHMVRGRPSAALRRVAKTVRYAVTSSDYWLFDQICKEEEARGFRSVFLFADGRCATGASGWLVDPSYAIDDSRISALMADLLQRGFSVGVHPGFNSYDDRDAIAAAIASVSEAAGRRTVLCRQHWLRFSLAATWRAQADAGVALDFTLGFNDRPGFRNGAALRYEPWDHERGRPIGLDTLPTIFMDSHFFDYDHFEDVHEAMAPWIDEVIAVGGEASLLWHTQTMHPEYGWGPGYVGLLDMLRERGAVVSVPRHD